MNILLNDAPLSFSGETLSDLLLQLERHDEGIAIAINQQVVPRSLWSETKLSENAHVFIFESIAGG